MTSKSSKTFLHCGEEKYGQIEIGFGGDRNGLQGQTFRHQLEHLKQLMTEYDPGSKIEFLEARPSSDQVESETRTATDLGMPYRQFTDIYFVGGQNQHPDALATLRANLEIATRSGTIDRLNMQVWGDNVNPTADMLLKFYLSAYEMAEKAGVQLYTETHIDRFTYDPRRLVEIHEMIRESTSGKYGLKVCADFSHYVHQIGNPKMSNWKAIESGELNLNPNDPENYVSKNIISKGMVGYAHLRMAIPNALGRGEGPIQYPLIDPKFDTLVQPNPDAKLRSGPFDESAQEPWKEWYRQLFRYQLLHPGNSSLRASSEFIVGVQPGLYRVDDYSNLFQNIAVISWAHKTLRLLQQELDEQSPGHEASDLNCA